MLCSLNHRQDIRVRENTKLKSPLLPFDKLDIGNDHLLTDSGYDNHSCINFPFHRVLNQVNSSADLLDEVV